MTDLILDLKTFYCSPKVLWENDAVRTVSVLWEGPECWRDQNQRIARGMELFRPFVNANKCSALCPVPACARLDSCLVWFTLISRHLSASPSCQRTFNVSKGAHSLCQGNSRHQSLVTVIQLLLSCYHFSAFITCFLFSLLLGPLRPCG